MDETGGRTQSLTAHSRAAVGERGSDVESTRNSGLIAQVAVSHPGFAAESISRQVTDTKLLVVEFSGRSDGTAIVFLEVESGNLSDFEVALTDADAVIQWEVVNVGGAQSLYSVHLDGLEARLRQLCADADVHVSRMVSHGADWLLDLRLPDREALTELVAQWREAGISFELKRITQTPLEERNGHLAELTAEQYELLWTAHQNGYFEVPRGASQTDLAQELGVSTSGFSQRVRRALGALLDSVFEAE